MPADELMVYLKKGEGRGHSPRMKPTQIVSPKTSAKRDREPRAKSVVIYCDGGARGNPGPAAAAFIVFDRAKIVHKGSKYLGITTNNVAEYRAVILALNYLLENVKTLKNKRAFVFVDSELVARQLTAQYKIKSLKLKPLFAEIKDLEEKIDREIIYKLVPRSKNRLADFLVNTQLDKKV